MYPFSGKTSKNLLIFIHFSIDISPLDFLFFIVAPFPPDGYEYFTVSRRSLCMIFFSSREI